MHDSSDEISVIDPKEKDRVNDIIDLNSLPACGKNLWSKRSILSEEWTERVSCWIKMQIFTLLSECKILLK